MLIDTHSHLFLEEFSDDLPQVMERARQAGVSRIYMPNIDSTTIEPMLSVCADYPDFCYPMIGLHPTSVNESYRQELSIVRERLEAPNNFVAIGEIGLDYHYDYDKTAQKSLLIKQIILADSLNLPVIIHLRDAYLDMENILKEYKKYINNGILFHCYSGSREMIDRFAFLDPYYAFGGAITFKNNNRAEVIKAVKKDRLMLETDCPYLTPVPHRGEINTPNNLKFVAERIALDLGMSYDEIAKITTENTKRFYNIK